ncbi:hypothetical protein O181_043921 [Austropuccinia psidii MF-1]|uniref:Integrase catalytic domain-containing protein n=1 Tax=Austropuccinia psidii MF-1 TaxID=1389203 RepID=A0A9Q3HGF5_9BASI|nr:hypothetical protein [Austropuccinia psidii MF-1]
MVSSKYEEENVTHVSTFLSRIRANNLFSKSSKCLFHVSSVEYLGYFVSSEGLKIDQAKVQQLLNWPPPRNLKALQSFFGFADFYRHFIKNYSKEISSLTSFLKKYSGFPSMKKLLDLFINSNRLSPLPQSFSTHHLFEKQEYSSQEVWTSQTSSNSKGSFYLAHLFIKNIFSKNGLPSSIVSDRGSLFLSSFYTNLCQKLKISRDLSTAYHLKTDGQTARVNQILEQHLQIYFSYHKDDWNTWIPLSESAYNSSDHSSTEKSLFFTFYGKDPHFDSAHIMQDTPAGNLSTKIQSD